MDVTWRQNALICLLSSNLSFMHHYSTINHTCRNQFAPCAWRAKRSSSLVFEPLRTPTATRTLNVTLFQISLPTIHEYEVKVPNFDELFSFLFILNAVANNLTPRKFAYTRQFKRVGQIVMKFKRTQIHFISDVSTTVAVLVV